MIYKYRRYQGQVPTDLTAPPSYPVYFYFLLFVLYELQVSPLQQGPFPQLSKYIQGRSQTDPCSGSHLLLRATGPLLYGPDANILGSIRCDACYLIPSVCLDHQPALPLPEEWVWPDLWSLHEPHLPYFRTDIRSIQPGSPGNTLSILRFYHIWTSSSAPFSTYAGHRKSNAPTLFGSTVQIGTDGTSLRLLP